MTGFARYCRIVLVYNLAVILWGAYVRATGSGAGCGGHWPLCNGEAVPRGREAATWIEYTHRVSSGLVLVLAAVLVIWAFRAAPRGHAVRRGAVLSLVLTLSEAALGAGLVLFRLVAHDESLTRAVVSGSHLLNTLLLLGALTLTLAATEGAVAGGAPAGEAAGSGAPAGSGGLPGSSGAVAGSRGTRHDGSTGALPPSLVRRSKSLRWSLAVGLAATMALAATGAVAALGDTLFPAGSLSQGLAQDLSPTSHVLLRLRTLHPLLALAVGIFLFYLCEQVAAAAPVARGAARRVRLLVLAQGAVGVVNIGLLAPVWLQLTHLLVADLLWIALVLMGIAAWALHPAAPPVRLLAGEAPKPLPQ